MQMADILKGFPVPMDIYIHDDPMDVDDAPVPMNVDDAGSDVSIFHQPLPLPPLPLGCVIIMTASAVMISTD